VSLVPGALSNSPHLQPPTLAGGSFFQGNLNMTTLDLRARLHALISLALTLATNSQETADELLSEAIAANAAHRDRASTAALLRKFADELEAPRG
jgi:hypothetical protein